MSNNNKSKSTNNNEFKLSTIYDSYTLPFLFMCVKS